MEICALTGSVTRRGTELYLHLHGSLADADGNVYGGHLSHGIIGATCEMVITVIDGVVDRVKDEETGLNIFNFRY